MNIFSGCNGLLIVEIKRFFKQISSSFTGVLILIWLD